MRREHSKRFGYLWFVTIVLFLTLMFSASFFLTAYLYRITNLYPPAWLAQVINSFIGLVFTASIASMVGRLFFARGWVPERNIFGPIIEALERIARGDFSVRLENEFRDNQMVGQLASSVNKMASELHQWERLRQEFISNVSHEIQSPLTSIRGFARALENDELSLEERHHYLSIIEAESMRLSRVTEDLLKLAALESDRLRFEPKPYRLDEQIRSLILVCEPQWTDKQIEMNVSLDEIEIEADEDLLSQVWTNLIHNGIKFTPQGGSVSIDLHQHDGGAEFKITDTGIGISETDQERVFERFFKADKARTPTNGGSGLGLSIAKKIIELHKGEINLVSKLNEGTTFSVLLPLKQVLGQNK